MGATKSQLRLLGIEPRSEFDPTLTQNPAYELTWSGDELVQIDKVVGDITYRKTLTWVAGNLVTISEWVKV